VDDRVRLVGRDAELAEIFVALDAAVKGRGSAFAFVGEPGIGKSSLLAAAAAQSRTAGLVTHVGPAYQPCTGSAVCRGVSVQGDLRATSP
jgi:predicted ABC-type transport system involved in lysophospholipase L1 biosynthesis ATPase subunit